MKSWITGLTAAALSATCLAAAMPAEAISGEVIGYGQGTATDSENRPWMRSLLTHSMGSTVPMPPHRIEAG